MNGWTFSKNPCKKKKSEEKATIGMTSPWRQCLWMCSLHTLSLSGHDQRANHSLHSALCLCDHSCVIRSWMKDKPLSALHLCALISMIISTPCVHEQRATTLCTSSLCTSFLWQYPHHEFMNKRQTIPCTSSQCISSLWQYPHPFIIHLGAMNNILTALSTSSLWPSTPPKMITQTPVWTFQIRRVWSLETDSSRQQSRGWNLSSFTAFPCPTKCWMIKEKEEQTQVKIYIYVHDCLNCQTCTG